MKVSIMISIYFVVILCQAAVAVEQFDLLPCTEGGSGGMLYCIEHDSVGEMCYLHDNITIRITVKLSSLVLTQLWLNQGEIVIMTPSGEAINNGEQVIRSEDRDRWTIMFTFQHVTSDYGKLHLVLHIKDVKYRDEQLLHVEIRTEDNIFKNRGEAWIKIHDLEGEARITDNPAEDPSAILQARIELLQKEKEALLEDKMTAENALIHYRTKYYHYLETKDNLEESTKPQSDSKGQGQIRRNVDIATLVILLIGTLTMAHIIFRLKRSKLISYAAVTLVNEKEIVRLD